MNSADKCPNCGSLRNPMKAALFECGTSIHFPGVTSSLCKERAEHQKTKVALTHTKDDLASLTWQIEQCKKELTETRNKLAAALAHTKEQINQIFEAVDKLEPYLSHNDHCFASRSNDLADCRCGLAERLKLIGYLRHKLNT